MKFIINKSNIKILQVIALIFCFSCTSKKEDNQIIQETKTIAALNLKAMKSSVYTTSHNSNLKLKLTELLKFGEFKQPLETEASIFVNPSKKLQTFVGIGAALTDAAAETFYKLTEKSKKFMEAYYSVDKGIGYSLGRTIIHSCDFSSGSYTYVEEGDAELKTFNIDHDRQFRLPFTKSN